MKPRTIGLEATSSCQLRCPSCPTASGAIRPVLGTGYLKFQDFQALVDANPWLSEIELSNYGEMFLNPDLLKILEYAHRQSVGLTANNGVNLNHARADVLEGLVKFRFRSLTCSIDGASNETYGMYRIGGSFDRVIENLRTINHYKTVYRSQYPRLAWQFVVFGHNEHEIPTARRLAADLNMKFYLKLKWDDDFSPVRNRDSVQREVGLNAASREEYEQRYGINYMREVCHQLWTKPQINWDGKVLGCCINFWGDFGGNVFREGLSASLRNEKMDYAKEMLLGKKAAREGIPCTTCDLYLSMKARGNWLTMVEIKAHSRFGRIVYHYRDIAMLVGWLLRWVRRPLGWGEQL
jgi:MoaA/NifB/PqqE/SkfB family radical SAM enzyme